MKVSNCFYFGYVSKIIGNKGELALKLDVDSPTLYQNLEAFFIQNSPKEEQLIPFFIEKSQILNNGLFRCSIEGISNNLEAKELVGKSVFLPIELLPELGEGQFYFHDIIGYEVIDSVKGTLGKVDQVLEYPKSPLLSIVVGAKEVLIPINDNTIKSVNKKDKILNVEAPEGLIDLYLE